MTGTSDISNFKIYLNDTQRFLEESGISIRSVYTMGDSEVVLNKEFIAKIDRFLKEISILLEERINASMKPYLMRAQVTDLMRQHDLPIAPHLLMGRVEKLGLEISIDPRNQVSPSGIIQLGDDNPINMSTSEFLNALRAPGSDRRRLLHLGSMVQYHLHNDTNILPVEALELRDEVYRIADAVYKVTADKLNNGMFPTIDYADLPAGANFDRAIEILHELPAKEVKQRVSKAVTQAMTNRTACREEITRITNGSSDGSHVLSGMAIQPYNDETFHVSFYLSGMEQEISDLYGKYMAIMSTLPQRREDATSGMTANDILMSQTPEVRVTICTLHNQLVKRIVRSQPPTVKMQSRLKCTDNGSYYKEEHAKTGDHNTRPILAQVFQRYFALLYDLDATLTHDDVGHLIATLK